MKLQAYAQVLSICIGSEDKWRSGLLYPAIVEHLRQAGIAGVTVLQGTDGYEAHDPSLTSAGASFFQGHPIIIKAVDIADRIALAIPILNEMIGDGLLTTADVQAIRYIPDPKG